MTAPIAHSNESMERFFRHILDVPTPKAVTIAYLKRHGFRLHNDPELRLILRQLGFLDEKGEMPTDVWKAYKADSQTVLREQVMRCYRGLFALYPDAARRNNRELEAWFSQSPATSGAESSIKRAIRTFKKLCVMANMMEPLDINSYSSRPQGSHPLTENAQTSVTNVNSKQPIFILPTAKNRTEYQEMFEALKEVFYSN